jgi:hypothetical protein
MTDPQENYLSMCKTLQITLNLYSSAWSSNPPFVSTNSEFNTFISELVSAKIIQGTNIKGYALDKKAKRDELTKHAVNMAYRIMNYADMSGNNTLLSEVSYTKSKFDKARNEIVIAQAQIIHDKATEHEAALVDYQITAGMISDLQTLIGRGYTGSPNSVHSLVLKPPRILSFPNSDLGAIHFSLVKFL